MNKQDLTKLIDVAAGRKPADLVLKNGVIIDVYQGTTMQGDVAIVDGKIAGIGDEYEGKEIRDLKGKYIAPGFIDPHIHVESSYVTPEEFGRLLVPHGTTTVMADPHEIVNVAGLKGLDYMIEAAQAYCIGYSIYAPFLCTCNEYGKRRSYFNCSRYGSSFKRGKSRGSC
jgi:adenine deaminase